MLDSSFDQISQMGISPIEFLARHPMTYAQLAARVGCSESLIKKWIVGQRTVTLSYRLLLQQLDEQLTRDEARERVKRFFGSGSGQTKVNARTASATRAMGF